MSLPFTDFNVKHTIIEQYGDIIEILEYEKQPPAQRNSLISVAKRTKKRKQNPLKYRTKRNIQRSYSEF